MIRTITLALALAALACCSPPQSSETSDAEGAGSAAAAPASAEPAGETSSANQAPAGAEAAITAWAREQVGASIIEPVTIFYGDFTGDAAPDALVWVDYDLGGSSANHMVALFRNTGGRMTHFRNDETVYGSEPRSVVFSTGRINLTTTMPRPNDPHCCPTGSSDWTITTN